MSDTAPNNTHIEEIDWSSFHIGIPCKYSEVAIIPKHIWSVVENEIICKCRGGELVLLELIEEYPNEGSDINTPNNAINADLSAMFGINIEEYTLHWEKRVDALNLRKFGWVKVRMEKIEAQESEKA